MEKQVLDFAFQYFCLDESLSSHLIEATQRSAGHPMVREVLRLEQTFVAYGADTPDEPLGDEFRHLGSLSIGKHPRTYFEIT